MFFWRFVRPNWQKKERRAKKQKEKNKIQVVVLSAIATVFLSFPTLLYEDFWRADVRFSFLPSESALSFWILSLFLILALASNRFYLLFFFRILFPWMFGFRRLIWLCMVESAPGFDFVAALLEFKVLWSFKGLDQSGACWILTFFFFLFF